MNSSYVKESVTGPHRLLEFHVMAGCWQSVVSPTFPRLSLELAGCCDEWRRIYDEGILKARIVRCLEQILLKISSCSLLLLS